MLQTAFARGDNVAHPTTASNLQAQKNKIAFAHEHGYAVSVLLVDTPTDVAVGRVRQRVRQGGHDVDIAKIVSSNDKARESYSQLGPLADHSAIVN
jgi:predicted ABC-type ATPase